jgi:hypothetical protein
MVAETVDHQAREEIALAMDQSIVGLIEKPLPQAEGLLQAVPKQLPVERDGVATKEAGADQRVGVDVGSAKHLAAVALYQHLLAGSELGKGRNLTIHLVTVDPQMSAVEAFFLVTPEA